MNLLDDLAGYTFEKIATEEMNEEDRYAQELAKAKKREQIGLGLMGGGFGGNLAINHYGQKKIDKLQKQRARESAERYEANKNNPFYIDFEGAKRRMNDVADFNKKNMRQNTLPVAAFWAGAGTLGYNAAKKRQARRRYEDYLNLKKINSLILNHKE